MISFVTLLAKDIERTADVYRLLGLDFISEQHGCGPVHLASANGGMVLEIFRGEDVASPGVMIGFEVGNLERIRTKLLEARVPLVRDINVVASVRRLIAADPEGRKIFLTEQS